MDAEKIGLLIRRLRLEKGYTQKTLAEALHVSDKTVSKWERGLGCPDIMLLPLLAQLLGSDPESILRGDLEERDPMRGNMKKTKFYVCPVCGNIITASGEASIVCCGRKLEPLQIKKADEEEKLCVQPVEDEYFITSGHEMTKEHYITFVALLTGDRMILLRQYPEWNLQLRLPKRGRGTLLWHCSRDGAFYQYL